MRPPLSANQRHHITFPGFVIFFLLLAFKSNDALTLPQFFAEDVSIFFKEQLGHSLPQLWVPYAGYLHVVPRMVAWLGGLLDASKAPLVYNLCAIILSAASLAYACQRMRDIIPLPLAAVTFLAVPISGEILGTITNVQWFLQFVIATACLTEPRSLVGKYRGLRDIALLAVALTGPFSIILALLIGCITAASWLDRRFSLRLFEGHLATWTARCDRRALAMVTMGALLQLVIVLTHAPKNTEAQRGLLELLHITFTDLAPIHTFGKDFLTGNGWLVVYVIAVTCLFFGKGMDGSKRITVLAMLCFACGEMFAPVRLKEVTPLYQFLLSDRYFYVFKVVFWWAAYASLVSWGSLRRADAAKIVTLFVALVAVNNIEHMRRPPFADLHWKQNARDLKVSGPHTIFVNPPGWGVIIDVPPSEPKEHVR